MELTQSQAYLERIESNWIAEFNNKVNFSEHHKTLTQHLFIKILNSFKEFNEKGIRVSWKNINKEKLYIDSVHTVNLGIDATMSNHVSVIPYKNKHTNMYDIDLMIGYMGNDFIRRKKSAVPIIDIRYELVYRNDSFEPLKKGIDHQVETYRFLIPKPFNRGEIIGGFGYIMYESECLNKLIIVPYEEFEKSKKVSKGNFWAYSFKEMCYKTVVHRVCKTIHLDPEKVNSAKIKLEENSPEISTELIDTEEVKEVEEGGPGF